MNLLSLSKDRDVLIVFFSPEGTVGPIALKIAKTIEERLGSDKVVAIAAVSEDPTKIRAWASRSPIPVVADLGARTAMRYKAQISPTFQLVGKGGTWGSKVEGCDATSMSELERVLKVKAGEFKDLASAKASDPQHIW
ncbi:MAG: hypothetical protein JNK63_02560 [Chthonomonas sp.]|nr:hypothetical protein [Chthonomonas sp.]